MACVQYENLGKAVAALPALPLITPLESDTYTYFEIWIDF